MSAVTVGNLSVRNHNSKCISELTQERDPMCVLNVGRPSTIDQILINTKQCIPETNLAKAVNSVKGFTWKSIPSTNLHIHK